VDEYDPHQEFVGKLALGIWIACCIGVIVMCLVYWVLT
jgi:hypothetical protein